MLEEVCLHWTSGCGDRFIYFFSCVMLSDGMRALCLFLFFFFFVETTPCAFEIKFVSAQIGPNTVFLPRNPLLRSCPMPSASH